VRHNWPGTSVSASIQRASAQLAVLALTLVAVSALPGRPASASPRLFGVGGGHAQAGDHGIYPRAAASAGARASATPAPAAYPVRGIDIASYQDPMNWPAAAASGISFAYIKATEGSSYTNPGLALDTAAAKANGLYVGSYAFARPDANNPRAQADFFVSAIGSGRDGRTLPPFVDLEGGAAVGTAECYGKSPAQLAAWIRAFLAEVRAGLSLAPLIYTSAGGFWSDCLGSGAARLAAGSRLDVASWNPSPGLLPAGWQQWTVWQYAADAVNPGTGGGTSDGDVFNGTRADLAVFAREMQVRGSTAVSPQVIPGGTALTSPHDVYRLAMQADGNLVIYADHGRRGKGGPIWALGTANSPGNQLSLQDDGNVLVLNAAGRSLWSTRTAGTGSGHVLAMQDDGNLVLYSGLRPIWYTGAPTSYAHVAGRPVGALVSPRRAFRFAPGGASISVKYVVGRHRLIWQVSCHLPAAHCNLAGQLMLQKDGNLVLYFPRRGGGRIAVWSTHTSGTGPGNELIMQDDGNLVLYGNQGSALWNSLGF
jgi:GH25 family lysozyme M1 (1,4-beta-N-acetylmuramidase)